MLRRTFLACLGVAAFTAMTSPVVAGGNGNGRGGGNGGNGGGGSEGGGNGGGGSDNGGGNGKGEGVGNGNSSSNGQGGGASRGNGRGSANGGVSAGSAGNSARRRNVDQRPAAPETPPKDDRAVFRVKHGNGFRETLSRGRYVLQDNRGRTVVDRAAKPKDYARLRRLLRPDS